MEPDEKWYFTKEQLANTPSRKCGYDADRELSCRQQAANFIQDMGQRLQVTQLCINTAIVYMHRFYVFHSFTQFHCNAIAAAALFLAAKVEEQPRKLEHVIKVAQMCLHRELPTLDTKSEHYMEQAQDLVMNDNVLLQTLGFDVAIDHPHTHVVRCCHLVKASKDLAQTSYFMASNSLHLTTMCLQYKPTVVACFCIHLACKWSNWEIPLSNESKSWFWYVHIVYLDRSVTQELLEQLTDEFLRIFDKCPSRLKRKISANQNMTGYHMGVNELNQKRPVPLPGSAGDSQHGVSFQQPNRGPRTNEEQRKKSESNVMLQAMGSHNP
ncbi:LOW QUALITY PROTEIN: cyclin-T2-like [Macrosteles quadrilineatus]|uniref:LOW QUALITY PROTEIN: cyclin-T2-like n=1 Tax=Macrosteles quadrilineatus TaxID=74068 RepID=UPI0023E2D3E4|nr:LOW QUALITY PROTEIN: cyclin-T2-like [Macrosteles quadrilineatus]